MNFLSGADGRMLNRPFLEKSKQSNRDQLLSANGQTYKSVTKITIMVVSLRNMAGLKKFSIILSK